MALQANDSEHGSWVTENVTIQALLSADAPPITAPEDCRLPEYGLLTRTVIESPVVQWILPARVRSAVHNDVAFIGDCFVQIRELQDDGQLHDIVRKADFGSRIRNAQVLGSFYEDSSTEDGLEAASEKAAGTSGIDLENRVLPPQLLVLVLESGDIVFLFLQQTLQSTYEFVAENVKPSRKERLVHPGFHLAIDPSSRYIVTTTCEGFFVVHELEPFDTLNQQFQATGAIRPIVNSRPRALDGIIHKAEFLFPGSANQETVILILVVIKMGISKLFTYEWAHGDNLKAALLADISGLRLPPEHRMPLLLIPLTVKTSFLSVSENSIAVFRDVLHGSSNPELVNTSEREQTGYHHGRGKPLWTAWTRPFRRKAYYESKDNIYLAREDGIVFFFEINSDEILESSLDVGDFRTNISTAFATVADSFSDIFILGGSCGDGSLWVVRAREPPVQIGVIPNWSPVLDFVTTDQFLTWNQSVGSEGAVMEPWNEHAHSDYTKHDRVFATAGRGINGNITELTAGIRANITLDVEYGSALRHVWAFPTPTAEMPAGLTVLLGLHNQSAVVELPPDLSGIWEPNVSEMGFDTHARTLAASQLPDGTICQVTETSLVLVGGSQTRHHAIAYIVGDPNTRAENACIRGSAAVFTTLSTQPTPGYTVLAVDMTRPGHAPKRYDVKQEVTCLSLCTIGKKEFLVAAIWQLEKTTILFYDINVSESDPSLVFPLSHPGKFALSLKRSLGTHLLRGTVNETGMSLPGNEDAETYTYSPLEAITTLVVIHESAEKTVIVGGTRGGYFLQLEMELTEQVKVTACVFEKFSTLPLDVIPADSITAAPQPHSVLLCCDSAIVLFEDYDTENTGGFKKRNRVVPIDPGSEKAECFQISSIAKIPRGSTTSGPILVVTGSRLLVARLEPGPQTISRRIHLGGTPSRLMYSHVLRCLVVAATFDDRPTLTFMDPDTGEDLSRPTDRNREDPLEFIRGLGHEGDRIHSLCEWLYTKDEKTFSFILVTTNAGRLLVVSATRAEGMVRFFTRYKKSIPDTPIYAVCADEDNIFFCAGCTVHWDKLDVAEKKIKSYATMGLASAATTLAVAERKLYALTQNHSLEVIDLDSVEQKKDFHVVGEGLMEQRTRPATHMLDVGDLSSNPSSWPLTLLSDRECGIAGARVPEKGDGREFAIVLEAELPASVRRFRRGHTRPPWWRSKAAQPRYGRIASTVDDAEILGICLDGSMQHFTLLSMEAWGFLRLIQDAATQHDRRQAKDGSYATGPPLAEPSTSPKTQLHVNGDILESILLNKDLGRLFDADENFGLFKRYLDELDGGTRSRVPKRADYPVSEMDIGDNSGGDAAGRDSTDITRRKYMALGYDVLAYFLSPVL